MRASGYRARMARPTGDVFDSDINIKQYAALLDWLLLSKLDGVCYPVRLVRPIIICVLSIRDVGNNR